MPSTSPSHASGYASPIQRRPRTGCVLSIATAAGRPISAAAFRRLALVSPTGFSGRKRRRGPPGSTLAMPWLHAALRGPGWGGFLFRQLTRPGVVRYFLRRTWGSPNIDEALWSYDVVTTRQPGAEHAPLHFLSGGLFSADISNIYDALTLPVWVSHGVRGDFTDYRGLAMVSGRPNWRVSVSQTSGAPASSRLRAS